MTDQAPPAELVFPRPPPFYQHFTPDNLSRLAQETRARDDPQSIRPNDVPEDLSFLVPPEPPTSGVYRVFGEERSVEQALPSLPEPIQRLVPSSLDHSDRPAQLLRISRSILLNFLELVGAMSLDPQFAAPKVDDLRTLFFNAHQLMNEYRPHQARESLIAMMEAQLQQKKDQVEGVAKMREKVHGLLATLSAPGAEESALIENDMQLPPADEQAQVFDRRREEQMGVWSVLDTIKI